MKYLWPILTLLLTFLVMESGAAGSEDRYSFTVDGVAVGDETSSLLTLPTFLRKNGVPRVNTDTEIGISIHRFPSGLKVVSLRNRVICVTGRSLQSFGATIATSGTPIKRVMNVLSQVGPQGDPAELPLYLNPVWPVEYEGQPTTSLSKWYDPENFQKLPFVVVCYFKKHSVTHVQLGDGRTRLTSPQQLALKSL